MEENTLIQLEQALHVGKAVAIRIDNDIKELQRKIKKDQTSLRIVKASKDYASEQLKFLKAKECVDFVEFNSLKESLVENTQLANEMATGILQIKETVNLATGSLKLVETNVAVLEKQIEDFDNIYFLEDYTDADAFRDD